MSGIVCAIRGGPASQPTIERAISLAKETELPLYFIYVVNLDFLTHTQSSRTHSIEKDLHHMGEFILLTVQSKAEAEGVLAEGIVRQGSVGEQIISAAKELEANYVVLGTPQGIHEADHFTQERFYEFIRRIEEESSAEVFSID
jgi:nucleotide-binding universal stress UspA family protein